MSKQIAQHQVGDSTYASNISVPFSKKPGSVHISPLFAAIHGDPTVDRGTQMQWTNYENFVNLCKSTQVVRS